jgi:predicted RNA binding protein YcfA (HicA-like mRNA interferase family)
MPKPKTLSGADLVRIFAIFGFEVESQRGSHIKLRRVLSDGARQTLTVPKHWELDRGTVFGIYRQALRYLTSRPTFFQQMNVLDFSHAVA